MNPHESTSEPTRRRKGSPAPLDRDALERLALRYAARWESSEAGVASHLESKIRERCDRTGADPEELIDLVPAIVERLVELRYVDDERFAETTIERMRRLGRSRAQIDARLQSKGIPASIRDALLPSAFADDGDTEAAWRLVRRRRIGPYCRDAERRVADRDRHLAILARQGFDLEIAERVIDADAPAETD